MTTEAVGGRSYTFSLRDRLRVAREQANFNQLEFADATGISRSSIQNYESGTTTPRRPQLIAWAMATGFSVDWLRDGQVTPAGPDGDGGNRVTARFPVLTGAQVTAIGQSNCGPASNVHNTPSEEIAA